MKWIIALLLITYSVHSEQVTYYDELLDLTDTCPFGTVVMLNSTQEDYSSLTVIVSSYYYKELDKNVLTIKFNESLVHNKYNYSFSLGASYVFCIKETGDDYYLVTETDQKPFLSGNDEISQLMVALATRASDAINLPPSQEINKPDDNSTTGNNQLILISTLAILSIIMIGYSAVKRR